MTPSLWCNLHKELRKVCWRQLYLGDRLNSISLDEILLFYILWACKYFGIEASTFLMLGKAFFDESIWGFLALCIINKKWSIYKLMPMKYIRRSEQKTAPIKSQYGYSYILNNIWMPSSPHWTNPNPKSSPPISHQSSHLSLPLLLFFISFRWRYNIIMIWRTKWYIKLIDPKYFSTTYPLQWETYALQSTQRLPSIAALIRPPFRKKRTALPLISRRMKVHATLWSL